MTPPSRREGGGGGAEGGERKGGREKGGRGVCSSHLFTSLKIVFPLLLKRSGSALALTCMKIRVSLLYLYV